MNKKMFGIALVLLVLFTIGTVTLIAQEAQQSTWDRSKTTVNPTDNGGWEIDTETSQCFYTGSFEYEKTYVRNRAGKRTVKQTTVKNTASYVARAYIDGAIVTFQPGQQKNYPGDVSVQDCP